MMEKKKKVKKKGKKKKEEEKEEEEKKKKKKLKKKLKRRRGRRIRGKGKCGSCIWRGDLCSVEGPLLPDTLREDGRLGTTGRGWRA